MRRGGLTIGLAGLLVSASVASALAEAKVRAIGTWIVRSEKDPFSSGSTSLAATTKGSDSLAIRCFSGRLSAILVLPTEKRQFEESGTVRYSYRADDKSISEYEGEVFSDYNVELPNAQEIFRDAQQAGQLAFKVSLPGGAMRTIAFASKNGRAALSDIRAGCGESQPSAPPSNKSSAAIPSQPSTSAATSASSRIDDETFQKLRRQLLADSIDAAAYSAECATVEASPDRLAAAALLSNEPDPVAALKNMRDAAIAVREGLVKQKRDLCAEAVALFGPTGSRFQNMVRAKGNGTKPN